MKKCLKIRPAHRIATLAVLIAMGAACVPEIADAKQRGTPQQRRACEPDAWRLCTAYFPFPKPVENCLRRNMRKLSPACRAVFQGRLS